MTFLSVVWVKGTITVDRTVSKVVILLLSGSLLLALEEYDKDD